MAGVDGGQLSADRASTAAIIESTIGDEAPMQLQESDLIYD